MKRTTSRIISAALIVLMVLSTTVTGFADEFTVEAEEPKASEKVEEKAPEKEEKKEEPAQQEKPEPEVKPEQEAPVQTAKDEEPAVTEAPSEESEKSENKTPKKSLKAALSDGRYEPDAFSFVGGTGKATLECEYVIIKGDETYAVFAASADTMTHIYMGKAPSNDETPSLYDPDTKKCGEDVYPINSLHVAVPVVLNKEDTVAVRTTAMSKPHWVNYTYNITLGDSAKKISDDTTIPEFEPSEGGDDPDPEPEPEPDPSDSTKLKDGTYKVNATTDRKMFYLYPKEKNPAKVILVKKNGKMTATITLTGVGYDYVYMGTPKQAKKAGKKNWIKYKKVKGYYTFTIPVSKLDKKLAITPHSKKYESDGDPSTEPWRPDKWIIFYSKGAKKVKDGTTIETKGKAKNRNSGKSSSKKSYADENNKGTSAVNNSTGLKDGTYKPDRFSWSGGSGRLAYIRCNKITVKGGKAYATIEFSSSKYDKLRANGTVYSKSGGGNSKFTIPVKLNANNHIVGRTTAMSMPHWVGYSIFIYKKGAGTGKGGKSTGSEMTNTKKLSAEAPELMGLEFKEEVKVEHAEYFKIYKYEQDITLIEVDQASDTALYQKEKVGENGSDEAQDDSQDKVEYDEDGNIIAKSQNEITNELYQNNVVNYLVVPKDVEIPAGLDKDCIIIQQPVAASYIASSDVLDDLVSLGVCDAVKTVGMEEKDIEQKEILSAVRDEKIKALGSYEDPDYAEIIKSKTDLALFPDAVLPEIVKDPEKDEEAQAESEKVKEELNVFQRRFSALGVPMIVDRSGDEKSNYGQAEWIKVYGVIYGQEEKAEAAFEKFTKENKEKKVTDD